MRQGNRTIWIFFLHLVIVLSIVSKCLLSAYCMLSIVLWGGGIGYSCQQLTALWKRQMYRTDN